MDRPRLRHKGWRALLAGYLSISERAVTWDTFVSRGEEALRDSRPYMHPNEYKELADSRSAMLRRRGL